jgi:hypothetical protein
MFGTIRKHQTWLWAVIITLTIISFVVFFSPYTKMNANVRAGNHGSINGKKITDQQFIEAYREVHLHHFMMSGRWPDEDKTSGFDPERETYNWLFVVQKQQDLGVHVSDEAASQMARNMLHNFERLGVTSPQIFFQKILGPKGYQPDDFERFVRHFVGIQELIATVGLSGKLIPPDQAKALYERDHQDLASQAVFFQATNYEAGITVAPETLVQYYSNRVANYIIPEKVQVNYVRFSVTNYLPQAQEQLTNINEIVDYNYQRRGTNAFPEAKTPEEAKAKIREEIFRIKSMELARAKALEFANVLFTMNTNLDSLKSLAVSNNLPVEVTPPFDSTTGPKDLEVGSDFTKTAFALTPDEPFSQPITGQDGVYVMALNSKTPIETPPFEKVKDKVLSDYKHEQAMRMARQAAATFSQSLTNGLAQGKAFTNICAEAGVKPVRLPPFSISSRSLPEIEEMVPLSQLKQAAFSTPVGKPSPLLPTSEGAMLLFVEAKLPLDLAKEQTDLPTYIAQVRRTRQQEAFDEWLQREGQQALRDTPIARPRQQPPVLGAKTSAAKS